MSLLGGTIFSLSRKQSTIMVAVSIPFIGRTDSEMTIDGLQFELEACALRIMEFLSQYNGFFGFTAVDFLHKGTWNGSRLLSEELIDSADVVMDQELVPQSWCRYLESLDTLNLAQLVSTGKMDGRCPDSLHGFITGCRERCIDKTCVVEGLTLPSRHALGMKPKKRHEIENLISVVSDLIPNDENVAVVDLGAGQGYLSMELAFNQNLRVYAVDYDLIQIKGAQNRGIFLIDFHSWFIFAYSN